jgi:O-antigen ligase
MTGAAGVERLEHTRPGLTGIAGWYGALLLGAGGVVTAALSVGGATPAQLVPLFLLAGLLAFAVTVAEPRWALVVLLFLLVGYLADRAGGELGLPDGSYRYAPVIALAVLVRRAVVGTAVELPPALVALVALVAATIASIFVAGELEPSLERLADLLRTIIVIALMVVLIDSPTWLRRAMWAVTLAAAGLSALTVYQQVTKSYDQDFLGLATVTIGTYPRSHGPTNPVFWAQSLAAASMLGLYLWLASRSRAGRTLAFVSFGLCLAAIAYTASRGAFLAVACALVLTAVLRPKRTLLPLAGVAIAIAVALPSLPDDYLQRFASLGSVVTAPSTETVVSAPEGSLRGRLGETLAAVHMFADHPVLGVGYGNYPSRYGEYSVQIGLEQRVGERTPHSLIPEALAETGVVGTVALLGVLGMALVGAWRARAALGGTDALLAEGAFVALVALLVAGMFLHIASARSFYIPVGLALAAGSLARGTPREPEPIR